MKTSIAYLTMLCCYVYYVDDSKKQENSDTQHIQANTYDAIGNPTKYFGSDLEWDYGRQLRRFYSGLYDTTYSYNADGMLIKQAVTYNTIPDYPINYSYENFYDGTTLIRRTGQGFDAWFDYDESGSPVGMNVTTTTGSSSNPTVTTTQYYFVKNLQGDIVAIADATGEIQFTYTYDSWGKVISTKGQGNYSPSVLDTSSPANINPFRYRGYYYDGINEIYWLQSRFYDPSTGRFLNADGYVTTGQGLLSTNMFLYCLNDPIQFVDDSGGRCVENDARSDWVMVTSDGRVVTNKNISRRTKASKTFNSADEAAKDFSRNYYSKSTFTHLEYGTEIYEHKVNGKIVYSYNPPRVGEAHAVEVGLPVPNGSRFVAYAHIHPTTNDFTDQDINLANSLHKDAYVIGPNQNLIGYNNQFNKRRDLGYVRVKELTDDQRAVLWAEYGGIWDEHADTCSACNELR